MLKIEIRTVGYYINNVILENIETMKNCKGSKIQLAR